MVRKGGPPKLDKQTVVVEDKEMVYIVRIISIYLDLNALESGQ